MDVLGGWRRELARLSGEPLDTASLSHNNTAFAHAALLWYLCQCVMMYAACAYLLLLEPHSSVRRVDYSCSSHSYW
jgi:hypothetical protein